MKNIKHLWLFTFLLFIVACNSKPTVVAPVKSSQIDNATTESDKTTSHKVIVADVLQTKKYTYLQVTEDKMPAYWIAISKAEVAKGETCIYTGGLKMHGFKSNELDRIFDDLILVSNISRPGDSGESLISETMSKMQSDDKAIKHDKIMPVKGATSIAELLANPKKYEGKIITVTGRCTKINHQIMNRNWIHLEDDSKDHKEITITSQDLLEIGSAGIFEGKISLNKDFGAGYRYEIIMEEAKMK
jgi:hypothetical protein